MTLLYCFNASLIETSWHFKNSRIFYQTYCLKFDFIASCFLSRKFLKVKRKLFTLAQIRLPRITLVAVCVCVCVRESVSATSVNVFAQKELRRYTTVIANQNWVLDTNRIRSFECLKEEIVVLWLHQNKFNFS